MKSNKFNTSWQITRVLARQIKDPQEKINFVISYLNKHPNVHSYDRVYNWLSMTKLGYFGERIKIRELFESSMSSMRLVKDSMASNIEDTGETEFEMFSDSDVLLVYKDLSKRKYGFKIKTVPKSHIEYMEKIESYLESKKLK